MEKINIIFLDIDGVMNSYYYYKKFNFHEMLEKNKVNMLKKVIKETNAKIVITSKRKMIPSYINEITNEFIKNGIDIYDFTKEIGLKNDEVKDWLIDHNNINNYVILDDNDCGFLADFKDKFIKISSYYGLTKSKSNILISILGQIEKKVK